MHWHLDVIFKESCEIIMNSLTNHFAFFIIQIVCSEGILLGGSNVLDKAQIEKSVLYPAFLFLGGGGKLWGRGRYGFADGKTEE